MATASEGFETPANGATITTTNCPVLTNVGNTVNNTIVCSTAQHAAGLKSARMTTAATADSASVRINFTDSATPHFRSYLYFDRMPTSAESFALILNARDATSVTRAGIRLNANGSVVMRDGAVAAGSPSVTGLVTPAVLIRVEWFIDVGSAAQTARIFVGANAHGTLPDSTLTGPYTAGVNPAQIVTGFNTQLANFGINVDDFGYDTLAYMGPSVVSNVLTANAGPDQSNKGEGLTVSLAGSATGGTGIYTYTWTQTVGTTVTLAGSGANRTFVVPALTANESLRFQLSVDDGATTDTDTVDIDVLRTIVANAGADQTNQAAGATVTLTSSPIGGSGGYVYTWTQLSGTSVTLNGTGANRTFTVPANTGETLTFRVSVTDSVGSTAHTGVTNVGIVPVNTSIAALTQNFNSLANGANVGTLFTSITGTGSFVATNAPALEGTMSARLDTATVAGSTRIAQSDDAARPLVYRLRRFRLEQAPSVVGTIWSWFTGGAAGTRVGDLRINTTRTLALRDGAATAGNGTVALALNTNYWIGLKVQPGSATGHVVKLYADNGTLLETITRAATDVAATAVDNWRIGDTTGANMIYVTDDLRADSAVELFPPTTAITANAGADQTARPEGVSVGVAGSATGGNGIYTYAWAQLSGPTVTLSGTGANRTFVVPGTGPGTVVLQLTVTDSAGSTAGTDNVSIGILGPVVANAGADQTAVEPLATVTLTGSASGGSGTGFVYTWTQLSGTTVTLSGTGTNRTYTAPAIPNGDVATFRLSATDSVGSLAHIDTVQITTLSHDNFYYDVLAPRPYIPRLRVSGAWT